MDLIKAIIAAILLATTAHAGAEAVSSVESNQLEEAREREKTSNPIEELNPFAPDIEDRLREYDEIYERETGLPAHLMPTWEDDFGLYHDTCYRESCSVWVRIVKEEQLLYLYLDGEAQEAWDVSTGMRGYTTPDFDTHPNGRIYTRYSSRKYPGGDYNGLGNMPYAVFIHGGFAIHGTPEGNWDKLGTPASHGCIRLHPHNAEYFNQLVRSAGIKDTWITIE